MVINIASMDPRQPKSVLLESVIKLVSIDTFVPFPPQLSKYMTILPTILQVSHLYNNITSSIS